MARKAAALASETGKPSASSETRTLPRDHAALAINGELVSVAGADLLRPFSTFLRERRGLRGTKVVCEEGDCGACSVLVGRCDDPHEAGADAAAPIRYRVVDSCILYPFQLDGAHVITIEGLSERNDEAGIAHALQGAMVEGHASQCGFCTPGIVVAATALLEDTLDGGAQKADAAALDRERIGVALSGNLCRCTGYVQIIKALQTAAERPRQSLNEAYPPGPLRALLRDGTRGDLEASWSSDLAFGDASATRTVLAPSTLQRALELRREHPEARLVAGATDVGVQLNKGTLDPAVVLDLNRVRELEGVQLEDDVLVAGARATWSEIDAATSDRLPELHAILEVFGAPQIRNLGTIGGNLANASPIADSLPLLFVLDAEVELASLRGRRSVPITAFYRGYKELDLAADELIVGVRATLPGPGEVLRLFKTSRRHDLDIASFTAAVRLGLEGERILTAALAFGAVGPTVLRARATEDFLIGRDFAPETIRQAGEIAVGEITPIDDVRGSRDFRYQLTRNVLHKTLLEWRSGARGAAA